MMEVFDTFHSDNMSLSVIIKRDDNSFHKALMKLLNWTSLEEDGPDSETYGLFCDSSNNIVYINNFIIVVCCSDSRKVISNIEHNVRTLNLIR